MVEMNSSLSADPPAQAPQPTQIQPRLVAVKTDLRSIVTGNYFEVSGKWEPDYLITPDGERVSRINLVAFVVSSYFSEDGNYGAVTLDDGTETIRLKSFKGDVKVLKDLKIGSVVNVIGKVRKFRDEVYISPETIVPSDQDRELLRKLEIAKRKLKLKSLRELVIQNSPEFDEPQKLIEFISSKYGFPKETIEAVLLSTSSTPKQPAEIPENLPGDSGDETPKASQKAKASVLASIEKASGQGIDYSSILRETALSTQDADTAIKELIAEGEIFEPRSGRFKRLV
ncbi:MAG: OB-fold nucleic acid binding domain-containing protein [archaeon]